MKSKRARIALYTTLAFTSLASFASPASAEFGVAAFDGSVTADGSSIPFTQAGGHPYDLTVDIDFNIHPDPQLGPLPDEPARDVLVDAPPGLVGNLTIAAKCSMGQLTSRLPTSTTESTFCPAESQVGVVKVRTPLPPEFGIPGDTLEAPAGLFSVVPPPNVPARFGFKISGVVVTLDAVLRSDGDYGLTVGARNTPEGLAITGTSVTMWGTPADPAHDAERWCPAANFPGNCAFATVAPKPFLTLPTACTPLGVGLETKLRTDSWVDPGYYKTASFFSHLAPFYPEPGWPGAQQGPTDCDLVPFDAGLAATPASLSSPGASGYAFDLTVSQEDDPVTGIAPSHVRKVSVTLPRGVRVSPSSAHGLQGCTSAQIRLDSLAEPSCPNGSKIGTLTIDTPLLEEQLMGAAYLAAPFDNPSGKLLALYLVARGPGVIVKLPGSVTTDPATGQLLATFDNNPQLPFSKLHLELNGGSRAPLSNPPRCGTYRTEAVIESWSGRTLTSGNSFTTSHNGVGAPCPALRFAPDLAAGSVNPVAGASSPLVVRLQRSDDDHEFSAVDLTLPPGMTASLRGVSYCPDTALGTAATKRGLQEQASASCPVASQIGTVQVGAGPGSSPFYATGKAYLAGPYKGGSLSVAVVMPAVAGPFDLGTVVVRNAIHVDPVDAQLRVVSDPLPRILEGIPLQIRDIVVNVDRPNFARNPTNCSEMGTAGQIGGLSALGALPLSAPVSQRFQVGDCVALPFKPNLSLKVKGATKRGAHPALRAELKAKPGEANIARAQVTLPHSEFLAQSHIRTICTRVQFAADQCPPGSVYGKARAFSPLLDKPLEGPVYLRSSSNPLPDLVASLKGQIDIDLVGRIDSIKGGIRNTFSVVPDAPVSKFVLEMKGGRKGLLENSRNLCAGVNRATVKLDGHNGKIHDTRPKLRNDCGKRSKRKR